MLVRNCDNGSAVSTDIFTGDLQSVTADVHRPRRRSTNHGDLDVQRANTDKFGWRGLSVSGRTSGLWNKLPPDIRKVSDKPEQFARVEH